MMLVSPADPGQAMPAKAQGAPAWRTPDTGKHRTKVARYRSMRDELDEGQIRPEVVGKFDQVG